MGVKGMPVGQVITGWLTGYGHGPQVRNRSLGGSPIAVVQAKEEWTVRRDGYQMACRGCIPIGHASGCLFEFVGLLARQKCHGSPRGIDGSLQGKAVQLFEVFFQKSMSSSQEAISSCARLAKLDECSKRARARPCLWSWVKV